MTGAERNQARKAEFIPLPGWVIGLLTAILIGIVLVAVLT